jgi:hypothetical protein
MHTLPNIFWKCGLIALAAIGVVSGFTTAARAEEISGKVTLQGRDLRGVVIALTGEDTTAGTTDSDGNYSIDDLDDGIYTVTPSAPGCVFSPAYRTVAVHDDVENVDFSADCPLSTLCTFAPEANAEFCFDTTPPVSTALRRPIRQSGILRVRYLITYPDHFGLNESVQDTIAVYKYTRRLILQRTTLRNIRSGTVVRYPLPQRLSTLRNFKFCVTSKDWRGNQSKLSCAKVP